MSNRQDRRPCAFYLSSPTQDRGQGWDGAQGSHTLCCYHNNRSDLHSLAEALAPGREGAGLLLELQLPHRPGSGQAHGALTAAATFTGAAKAPCFGHN